VRVRYCSSSDNLQLNVVLRVHPSPSNGVAFASQQSYNTSNKYPLSTHSATAYNHLHSKRAPAVLVTVQTYSCVTEVTVTEMTVTDDDHLEVQVLELLSDNSLRYLQACNKLLISLLCCTAVLLISNTVL
jgi:hypothetical protein